MVTCKVNLKIGVISENENSKYTKELRLITWGENSPKYDIRTWKHDNEEETAGKGITLNKNELINLRDLINSILDK